MYRQCRRHCTAALPPTLIGTEKQIRVGRTLEAFRACPAPSRKVVRQSRPVRVHTVILIFHLMSSNEKWNINFHFPFFIFHSRKNIKTMTSTIHFSFSTDIRKSKIHASSYQFHFSSWVKNGKWKMKNWVAPPSQFHFSFYADEASLILHKFTVVSMAITSENIVYRN